MPMSAAGSSQPRIQAALLFAGSAWMLLLVGRLIIIWWQSVPLEQKGCRMGFGDDVRNKAQDVKGQAKEGLGKATDNEQLESEGKFDQLGAKAKEGLENIKDKASEAFNDITDKLDKNDK